MNNYEKYHKMNDSEVVKSQLKEEKNKKEALQKIQKKVKKAIIKKNVQNCNFSPFMKTFYKFAL
tara:strand:- start:19 stop:210 length:192 start_codon:yes stop_codon:yes gene_type:complete